MDQKIAFLAAEQHLDRVAWIEFSVQVSSEPTEWVAGNGELAAQGWVSHKILIVGYTKSNAAYTLRIIGTGPKLPLNITPARQLAGVLFFGKEFLIYFTLIE